MKHLNIFSTIVLLFVDLTGMAADLDDWMKAQDIATQQQEPDNNNIVA